MKKYYTAFVIIFWLTMTGLLFNKEVLPSFIISNPSGYKIDVTKDSPMRESWMGVYFKDAKVGFSNTVVSQDVDMGTAGYRINETILLKLNILGQGRFIRVKGSSFFTDSYNLKNFYYKLTSGAYSITASGALKDNILKLKIDTDSGSVEKELPIKSNVLISSSISPVLLFKKLDKNKELNFEIFDPVSMSNNRVTIRKIGSEVIEIKGVKNEADIFEIDCFGIKTKTWMAKNSDILKEESGMGFTMIKEDAKSAMDISRVVSEGAKDLLSEFSLISNIEIQNPRDTAYLKVEKNEGSGSFPTLHPEERSDEGSLIEIFKDKEPEPSTIQRLPIEDIPEEPFIQSNDERIIKLAKEITGEENDSWQAARKILKWVYTNLKKTPTLSIPSALDILSVREGDCNEHTVLFTALTRSIGMPTKMIAGLVYLDGAFYYHAWPMVYVGEWIDMDPTLGQEIADATHIGLVEGGIKEQLELIRIISELKIRVVDYK